MMPGRREWTACSQVGDQQKAPDHYRRSRHRAQTANTPKEKGVREDHHGSTMDCAQPDVKPATAGLGGRIHLAHLGFGRQGDCILQAEGDDRLRRNGEIAVAGKGCTQGSGTAAGQTADEQTDAAGG
jgi:hypothetical protein